MTSRRDSYAEEVAEWADVSLSQRIAAGFSHILNTATAIEEMLIDTAELTEATVAVARIHEHATAALLHLAPCRLPASARDPELSDILTRIERELTRLSPLHGPEYDLALDRIERRAARDVLSLFYEIKRLEHFQSTQNSMLKRVCHLWRASPTVPFKSRRHGDRSAL